MMIEVERHHRTPVWAAAAVVVLVCVIMVEDSVELRTSHPLHTRALVERISHNSDYVGLVMAFPTEQAALLDSGFFVPNSLIPWVDLAGRRFNVGKIKGVDVIYVMTGEQTVNAGITVQILLNSFDVRGVVHYGIAGSADDSLSLGDVCVPSFFAFTASWKWKEFKSNKGQYPEMEFGDFDFPTRGENLLGKVEFTPQQLYSTGKQMEELFWLPTDPIWLTISTQLQDLKLQACVNETYCLPQTPKVVYGLRGSTANVYLSNAAYREFLFKQFNVSTVDEESAAVVMTCLSNGVPSIVFRGVSDMAGGGAGKLSSSSTLMSLAASNALNVAVEFIGLLTKEARDQQNHDKLNVLMVTENCLTGMSCPPPPPEVESPPPPRQRTPTSSSQTDDNSPPPLPSSLGFDVPLFTGSGSNNKAELPLLLGGIAQVMLLGLHINF